MEQLNSQTIEQQKNLTAKRLNNSTTQQLNNLATNNLQLSPKQVKIEYINNWSVSFLIPSYHFLLDVSATMR